MKDLFEGVHSRLMLAIFVAGLITAVISFVKNNDSETFYGIAESKEIVINFDHPVVLKRLQIVPGKKVKKGELLAEFSQVQLDSQIAGVKNQIDEIRAKSQLIRDLKLDKSNSPPSAQKKGKKNQMAPEGVNLSSDKDPAQVKLEYLLEQLKLLTRQKEELLSYASEDSTVGSINFKEGENVPSFTPAITLVPAAPLLVRGYIHESIGLSPVKGQSVIVSSIGDLPKKITGTVSSIGERIVAFPDRLKPRSDLPIWGREIVVQLPENNSFLIGEKVVASVSSNIAVTKDVANASLLSTIGFAEAQKSKEMTLAIPKNVSDRSHLEPSGLLYLRDLDKFLFVSDEPSPDGKLEFYLLNMDGTVEDQSLVLDEPHPKMLDMESLSQDSFGNITVLSSLSLSKGEDQEGRDYLIRMAREKMKLRLESSINIKRLLLRWAKDNPNSDAAKYLGSEINIEGHFWNNGDLFLGLKEPLGPNNQAVILKISQGETLSDKRILGPNDLSVWKTLELQAEKKVMGVSDLMFLDGNLYILSSCIKEKYEGTCGAFWKYGNPEHQGDKPLQLVRYFDHATPEGLSFRSSSREFMIVFDAGHKGEPTLLRISEGSIK